MHEITLAGEDAILIYLGHEISEETLDKVVFYHRLLQQHLGDVIIDSVPSYASILIRYRLDLIQHEAICQRVKKLLAEADYQAQQRTRHVMTIPVYYSPEVGLDLNNVMTKTGLSLDDLIQRHCSKTYLTYAIGFSPVFAFLGKLDPTLALPRLATPRISIPAGSVAIAEQQTAVYPLKSAGGWNIIGRTPLDLSLTIPDNINKFVIGQEVKFTSISRQDYLDMGGTL